jgi:hypothetical protein
MQYAKNVHNNKTTTASQKIMQYQLDMAKQKKHA